MKLVRLVLISCAVGMPLAGCAGAPAPAPGTPGHPPPDPDHACTEIGCVDGFSLQLSPSEAWPAGTYRFAIQADGKSMTCEGALPLPPCDAGPALKCDGELARIGESGCALNPSAHGFSDIQFTTAPANVEVEIFRDGVSIARQSYAPKYVEGRPNGADCPPVCHSANDTLAVK